MISIPSHYNREQVRFFLLGFCYQAGVLHGHRFMLVEDAQSGKTRWITLKNKQHALIDDDTGRVLSGAGGALKGKRFVKSQREAKGDTNAIVESSPVWRETPAIRLVRWGTALDEASKKGLEKVKRMKANGDTGEIKKLRVFFKNLTKDLPSTVIVRFPNDGDYLVRFPKSFFKELFAKTRNSESPAKNLEAACLVLRHLASTLASPDSSPTWGTPINEASKPQGAKMCSFSKVFHKEGFSVTIDIMKFEERKSKNNTNGAYSIRQGYSGNISLTEGMQHRIAQDEANDMPILEVVGIKIDWIGR